MTYKDLMAYLYSIARKVDRRNLSTHMHAAEWLLRYKYGKTPDVVLVAMFKNYLKEVVG